MSNENAATDPGQRNSRAILIYGLFGPPVGGLIAYIILLVYAARGEYWWADFRENTLEVLASLSTGLIAFPLYGYLFGGVQALLTGLIVKTFADTDGRFGYMTAFVAATLVGVVVGLFLTTGYFFSIGYAPVIAFVVLAVIGITASLIVRFLFRKRFRPIQEA